MPRGALPCGEEQIRNKFMVTLTFPDGAAREYEAGTTAMQVAKKISKGLAKQVLAAKLDGKLVDASLPIEADAKIELVTAKDPEGVELIRHDAAHVLAEAVQELFPGTQVTIGPVIENGFYYDFHREEPFSADDFAAIEKKMGFIINRNDKFERQVMARDEAIALFKGLGEHFKVELIEDLPEDEVLTIYKQGKWFDLCFCLLYTSPSPRDQRGSRMPSSA